MRACPTLPIFVFENWREYQSGIIPEMAGEALDHTSTPDVNGAPQTDPFKRMVVIFNHATDPLETIKDGPEASRANVLLCIASEALSCYHDLYNAAGFQKGSLCAYCVRSLLELAIWNDYCLLSTENAARFLAESDKDMNGLYQILRELPKHTHLWPNGRVDESARQCLEAITAGKGQDTKFLRVSEVADLLEPGTGDIFKVLNKMLSKFAHPTALVVTRNIMGDNAKPFCTNMLQLGTTIFGSMLICISQATPKMLESTPVS